MNRRLLTLLGVGMIALGLRLVFIFTASGTSIIWDASIYWDGTQAVRSMWCNISFICEPTVEATTPAELASLIFGREGLLPAIMGTLLTVLPNEPDTAYVIQAVMDALLCMMIVQIVLRLYGGWTAALLAGLAFALYVPAITGTGVFLQQPLLRFGLVVGLWGYTLAFTAQDSGHARAYVFIGMIGALLAGYGSITTRPVLWLMVLSPVVIGWFKRRDLVYRAVSQTSLGATAVVVAFALALAVIGGGGGDRGDALLRSFSGLGSGGQAIRAQSTIVSFDEVWAPSSWETLAVSETESIIGDALGQPVLFAQRLGFSVVANFRYPDTSFMQAFGLGIDGQHSQHTLLMLAGLLGVVYLISQRDARRDAALWMILVGGAVGLLPSIVGMEPRRVSPVLPLLAVGAGFALDKLARTVWARRGFLRWYDVVLVVITAVMWVPGVRLPLQPAVLGYSILLSVRLGLTAAVVWRVLAYWRTDDAIDYRWPGVILTLGLLGVAGAGLIQDPTWREYSVPIGGERTQTVRGLQVVEHLHPWVIVDVDDPNAIGLWAADRQLKAADAPMLGWHAGLPPVWSPYGTISMMATAATTLEEWHTVALPPDLFRVETLTLRVTGEARLYADRIDNPTHYTGPAWSPFYDGDSFWRWQWNGRDPRIPVTQFLGRARYENDTDGLYRLFVVQMPFGPQTNAFGAPQNPDAASLCGQDVLVIAPGDDDHYICRRGDAVDFYAGGTLTGTTPLSTFTRQEAQNTLLARVETEAGRVDVIQVLNPLFVASLYTPDGDFIYSILFEIR